MYKYIRIMYTYVIKNRDLANSTLNTRTHSPVATNIYLIFHSQKTMKLHKCHKLDTKEKRKFKGNVRKLNYS